MSKYCLMEYVGESALLDRNDFNEIQFKTIDSALSRGRRVFKQKMGREPKITNGDASRSMVERNDYYISVAELNDDGYTTMTFSPSSGPEENIVKTLS